MRKLFIAAMVVLALASCKNDKIQHSEWIDTDRWELAWNDEFDYQNRDELLEVWQSSNGPTAHTLCSRWPENVEVTGSTVRLVNHKESRGGQDWTSASINTKEDFQYGYFECRYKYAAATGANSSFWLMTRAGAQGMVLPGAKVPEVGKQFELDVNEGHYPDKVTSTVQHWSSEPHEYVQKKFTYEGTDFSQEFHIFGMEWTEKEIAFFVDGKETMRTNNEYAYSTAPVLLSMAVTAWAGEVTDAIDGTFMEVDYVRVYKEKANK